MTLSSVTLGDITVTALIDGEVRLPAELLFPTIQADQWRPFYPDLIDESGTIALSLGAFVVQHGRHITLVDTGVGLAAEPFHLPSGGIERGLAELKIRPEDIDLVILTHMHADHLGGACCMSAGQAVPKYRNARYIVDAAEWRYWVTENNAGTDPSLTPDLVAQCALPLEAHRLLDLTTGACKPAPHLTLVPTPGHTPGHCAVLVSSGSEHLMIIGDAAHCPAQVVHADWVIYAGADKALEAESRLRLFDTIEAAGMLIGAGHYHGQNFGRFVRRAGVRTFEPLTEVAQ